jgi:hypothetical protein
MSEKPVAERLQVKGGRRLAVIGAPADQDAAIGAGDARAVAEAAEIVLWFAADRAGLDAVLPAMAAAAGRGAIVWVAYPKLTSTLAADLSRDAIRGLVPAHGLDTVSQIAIDADWSALRLKVIAS